MTTLVLKLVLTPSVMVGATLAGRRWGGTVSGWLVGFPLTSGPLVLYLALDHGRRFAAHTAVGSLSGAIAEVAFCLGYGLGARRSWKVAVLTASAGFAAAAAALQALPLGVGPPLLPLLAAVVLALAAGLLLLPRPALRAPTSVRTPGWDLAARAAVATCLVLALAALAPTIGARLTGLLAVYPLYSAVLAVFAHRLQGHGAAIGLLRGLLAGLFSFAAFYAVLPELLVHAGTAAAFACAIPAAVAVQAFSGARLFRWERSTTASTGSSQAGSSGSGSSSLRRRRSPPTGT